MDRKDAELVMKRLGGTRPRPRPRAEPVPEPVPAAEVSELVDTYAWGGNGIQNGLEINGNLRAGGYGSMSDSHRQFVDRLDRAMEASTDRMPRTLHRIIDDPDLFDRLNGAKAGDVISDDGYVSTTSDPSILDDFDMGDGARVDLQIRVPNGQKGISVDAHTAEDAYKQKEYLLPRGTGFRVVSRKRGADGQPVLVVEPVPPQTPADIDVSAADVPDMEAVPKAPGALAAPV